MLSLSETSSNYSFYLFNHPYSYILLSSYTIRPIFTLIYSFHPTQSVPSLLLYTPFILHNPSQPYTYILLSYYTIRPILTLIYSFHTTQSFPSLLLYTPFILHNPLSDLERMSYLCFFSLNIDYCQFRFFCKNERLSLENKDFHWENVFFMKIRGFHWEIRISFRIKDQTSNTMFTSTAWFKLISTILNSRIFIVILNVN